MNKEYLRSLIFRHLDGLAVVPIVATLSRNGVLDYMLQHHRFQLDEVSNAFKANEGYMNVALRALAAQGFLTYELDAAQKTILLTSTALLQQLRNYLDAFTDFEKFLSSDSTIKETNISEAFSIAWYTLFEKYQACIVASADDQPQYQICKYFEGVLIGPLIVKLGMSGLFHKYFMDASFTPDEFHKNPQHFERVLDGLVTLGWFTKQANKYKFNDVGLFFARRAAAYGVTVSYLPMFARLQDLLFGDAGKLRAIADGEDEIHVNREMNVWGSGGAHATYFKVVDEFIKDIFNQPIELQPKGILDMGCGNGALLQHLYDVIERQTLRGKYLDEYPLFLVGADYNQAALKVTRANLIKNDIWAKVIWGDIGYPARLAHDLKTDYDIELSDLLNMRTFLDHNRIWEDVTPVEEHYQTTSTGAFAFRGARLDNALVEQNLQQHLQKWEPYVAKYGLLLIELHTINPTLTAANLGKTAATAYDATHGFSDQYILEVDVFHKVCKQTGLESVSSLFRKFPNNNLATVSINLLKRK